MTKNLWIAAVIAALVGLLYFGPTRSYIMSKVPSVSLPSLSMPKMPWSKPDLPKEPDLSKIELPKVPDFVPEPEPEPEPAAEEAKPSWRDLVKIPPLPWILLRITKTTRLANPLSLSRVLTHARPLSIIRQRDGIGNASTAIQRCR
jgi:hypothetical protein